MKNKSIKIDSVIRPTKKIKSIPDSPKKILFIKPSSLGDIFHALPAFYLLKASCPGCQIDWLINQDFAPVLECIKKDLNKIIYFDRKMFKKANALTGFIRLVRSIRKERYDLVIDLQGLLRSSLMAFIARTKRKAGFADTKEKISVLMYNEKIDVPKDLLHAIERNAYLVSKVLKKQYFIPAYSIGAVKRYKNSVLKILKKHDIKSSGYIAFAPGARWKTKCWPSLFFADVADAINSVYPELNIVLVGTASDRQAANEIISKCKLSKPVSFAGETNICELIEVLRGASSLLTNDSGPMHIAAALRVPVFALFGPTDPEKTGPFWQWHKIYQDKKGCIKCLKRICEKKTLECQKNISSQEVANDIVKKLRTLNAER